MERMGKKQTQHRIVNQKHFEMHLLAILIAQTALVSSADWD